MLQRRQRFDQPPAPLVNEQTRPYAGLDIAERCRISAQPFTRSVFARRSVIPCRAYCAATVVPSLCRENTSAPATNRFKSEISNGRVSVARWLFRPIGYRNRCRASIALIRRRVPLRQPQPLRVFIHDENIAVAIRAAEQRRPCNARTRNPAPRTIRAPACRRNPRRHEPRAAAS